ncbi:hypothetical protein [Methylocaldum sp.]|uniref:hypothetical protein n=1 Tax=Methylocaldum sp. TaxID=1969727 RepID=UPI002D70BD88|nr:hypothetical protein [Methylocaldum sp.]HYE35926.1 hypothetical protein [Methylocaldum sp.]
MLWQGTKRPLSSGLILVVPVLFGLVQSWLVLCVLSVAFLAAIYFGVLALVISFFARSYEFFVYYITVGVTQWCI